MGTPFLVLLFLPAPVGVVPSPKDDTRKSLLEARRHQRQATIAPWLVDVQQIFSRHGLPVQGFTVNVFVAYNSADL